MSMIYMLSNQAKANSRESFECGNCGQKFDTKVITSVDISKTPKDKQVLLKWRFNIIQCTHCGYRHFSGTPFFFEDFEEGLLIAVSWTSVSGMNFILLGIAPIPANSGLLSTASLHR